MQYQIVRCLRLTVFSGRKYSQICKHLPVSCHTTSQVCTNLDLCHMITYKLCHTTVPFAKYDHCHMILQFAKHDNCHMILQFAKHAHCHMILPFAKYDHCHDPTICQI